MKDTIINVFGAILFLVMFLFPVLVAGNYVTAKYTMAEIAAWPLNEILDCVLTVLAVECVWGGFVAFICLGKRP